MAGNATFVPSSGNRGYSRNRTFPFKGTPLRKNTLWERQYNITIATSACPVWILRAALGREHLGTWGRVQVQRIKSDECVRWGTACRITNFLESNSGYQGLGGRHTPGRVGPDSHGRRLTGRLISKWDGLDHPLAHPLLRCRDPLLVGQDIRTTVNFYATGQLCGYKHLMSVVGKANRAFPGPQRIDPQVPRRKTMIFPNDIPPKGMW